MTLRELTHPQWLAALETARLAKSCNPHDAQDRQRFRTARNRFVSLLPHGVNDRDLVTEALHWDALNDIAAFFETTVNGVRQ